jgi:hypothetical protein
MSVRTVAASAAIFMAAFAVSAAAQEGQLPSPEEYAKKAAKAEAAPLFHTAEPLRITLHTDIKWLRDKRSDEEEVEGTITIFNEDGTSVEKPVKVRARGNFRRDKRNCNFPPLRLNFQTGQMKGTVFEGQDKLKLVTPCHDSRGNYQDYVFQEYLTYKTFDLLTPIGFRTRLVEITYEDVNGKYDTRTKMGFIIEDEEQMAERNRATFQEWEQFHPASTDGETSVLVAMFNYMIGNTDWSPIYFHNVKLIRTEDSRYLTVPYDFDFSGAVNARYASPDPKLSIKRVTDRLYRGFCRPELNREAVAAVFNAQKDAIWSLYQDFPYLEAKPKEKTLKFYDKFYETINDERKFDRQIVRACRNW